MTIDSALAQIRPFLSLAGSVIIAIGLAKFFGFAVPFGGSGIELAVAGWLLKGV